MSDSRRDSELGGTPNSALHRAKFEEEFLVGGDSVSYKLVGRVMHQPLKAHFVAELDIDGVIYEYDDMQRSGKFIRANPALELGAQGDPDVVFYMYNRFSVADKVSASGIAAFLILTPLCHVLIAHPVHSPF
jgi:hypothetical protein